MDRLFKRAGAKVACGLVYAKKVRFKGLQEVRVEGLTEDLSIEGARMRAYERLDLKPGQLVLFDLGTENHAKAIVRGIDPAGSNSMIRLEFIDAEQAFLAEIVPHVKSKGVSDAAVHDWSAR